tara:strand:- start:89 stop:718 length:630 start_codon:yes stop_codon:yes gene_type:complete
MANYYSYFDDSAAGQNTRSQIDEESAIFGMGVSQDINCGIITATAGSFSGNVSVGGTLTYEDVKNVDSIGIITARSGIAVTGGQLIVGAAFSVGAAGVVTATSYYGDGSALTGISGVGNTDYVVSIATTTGNLNVTGVATIGIATVTKDLWVGAAATVGILTVSSALYPPAYTTTQRDAATFAHGAIIYNLTTQKLNYYNGSWKVLSVD